MGARRMYSSGYNFGGGNQFDNNNNNNNYNNNNNNNNQQNNNYNNQNNNTQNYQNNYNNNDNNQKKIGTLGRPIGSLNRVTLLGNVGLDPYVKEWDNGTKFVSFSVA